MIPRAPEEFDYPATVQQIAGFLHRSNIMKDIIAGVVLIGIGFAFGGSVFLGDFSVINIIFDGLGTFWIVKGIVGIVQNKG